MCCANIAAAMRPHGQAGCAVFGAQCDWLVLFYHPAPPSGLGMARGSLQWVGIRLSHMAQSVGGWKGYKHTKFGPKFG